MAISKIIVHMLVFEPSRTLIFGQTHNQGKPIGTISFSVVLLSRSSIQAYLSPLFNHLPFSYSPISE